MHSNFLLRSFRILLFPIALVYGAVVKIRNWMYAKGYLKSVRFNLPIINVGNLSVGGTGKSPMVEFLLYHLQQQYAIATLSRGYRRKTKGYILANEQTTALEIGDEPLMFYKQFKNVAVAVGEERVLAIPQLLQDRPETQVVILDDAFQHRAINPSLHIVLTAYNNLYVDDYFLPTGDLRDEKNSIQRAAIVVVSKCPSTLTIEESVTVKERLHLHSTASLFFSAIVYAPLVSLQDNSTIAFHKNMEVLLVTGIANPKPMEQYLENKIKVYEKLSFGDHHIFTTDDIKSIEKQFSKLHANHAILITTQKDAMRLLKFGAAIKHLPIYILPIQMEFLFDKEQEFLQLIQEHIANFSLS
jgi:tetraacyldisaccharide 4'-kinase